jgi:hypothetical protein
MLFLMTTTMATLWVIQAPDSGIAGVVTDAETGSVLAGAVLTVASIGRTSTTDADGSYLLAGLAPGSNEVVVARAHYHTRTFRAIVPIRGTVRIDIALHPAPTNLPAIEVRATLPSREVAQSDWSASFDRSVSAAAVRSDPRLAEPDPLQALSGGEVGFVPESPEGLHVLGGASDQVTYRLDGVPVFSPYHGSGTFSAWNPDALDHLDLINTPGSGFADGLSGTVSAATIIPAPRQEMRGSVSSTQARSTLDGPLGWADAGFLLSLRSTFPGLLGHLRDGSYVQGESADWLVKLQSPLAGGRVRFLGYGSHNEISSLGSLGSADSIGLPSRNQLSWQGESFGADWSRQIGGAAIQLRLWSAAADAGALWPGAAPTVDRLDTRRRDVGAETTIEVGAPGDRTSFRFRVGRSATFYRILPVGIAQANAVDLTAGLWATGLTHEKRITARGALALDLGAESWRGGFHIDPGATLRWRLAEHVSVSTVYSHRHQFAQSLRNPESVVGGIFPADLFVDAGPGGVPIASSDLGVVTLAYTPGARVRLTGRAYLRNLRGLALVSPRSEGPFADVGGFVVGSGSGGGIAMAASVTGPRYGLLFAYALQRMHLAFADSGYVPGFSVTHSFEAGAHLLPFEETAVNLGLIALVGRHGAAVTGPFEWEGCNLLDRGCEFAGSPRQAQGAAAALDLPAYLRLDLGIRKRWVLHVARRDAELAVFGTLTNVLNRHNILTDVIDPATGARGQVEMRPRSPLTIGLDWRY